MVCPHRCSAPWRVPRCCSGPHQVSVPHTCSWCTPIGAHGVPPAQLSRTLASPWTEDKVQAPKPCSKIQRCLCSKHVPLSVPIVSTALKRIHHELSHGIAV
eukprot:521875-Pelagomonas_calceolata.AAC.2